MSEKGHLYWLPGHSRRIRTGAEGGAARITILIGPVKQNIAMSVSRAESMRCSGLQACHVASKCGGMELNQLLGFSSFKVISKRVPLKDHMAANGSKGV